MIEAIIFIFLTALASVAHGGDYVGKGLLIAVHGLVIWILCGPVFLPWALLWWYVFRRSWHARAELDYITGKTGLDKIEQQYPYLMGPLAAEIAYYCKHTRWPFLGERRQQELLITLLVTAPVCAIIPAILSVVR